VSMSTRPARTVTAVSPLASTEMRTLPAARGTIEMDGVSIAD